MMPPQARACSGSSSGLEASSDGLFNYEVHEEIGRGSTAAVYRATCKRGRLRNRQVALKQILTACADDKSDVPHFASSTTLHQALHHPSIVSLLSSFSTSSGQYHVLELCSRGTLSSYLKSRQPSVLSEGELRGVMKSLVDALVYLRKERVLHRDLKASNILLTEDFRIKLSDFGLATRLPSSDSTASTFCGSPNYVAPEVISRQRYSFGVDTWSLGCVMVTCLTGIPAFEAPSVHDIFENTCSVSYTLPAETSPQARDLISALLQLNPADRIPLHQILLHSFFDPSLFVTPLSDSSTPHMKQPAVRSENALPLSKAKSGRYPTTLSNAPLSKEHPLTRPTLMKPRKPMASFTNKNLRDILSDELSRPPRLDTRRVVSAPESQRVSTADFAILERPAFFSRTQSIPTTPTLTADSESLSSMRTSDSVEDNRQPELGQDQVRIQHALLSLPKQLDNNEPVITGNMHHLKQYSSDPEASEGGNPTAVGAPVSSAPTLGKPLVQAPSSPHCRRRSLSPPVSAVPITTSLTIFNTFYLNPQTHKVAQGQVVVLPSRSLLVDLRESERRKGRKGDEVLVVSADGKTINVYSAPHLSTPCCLAESIATYTVGDLPAEYWKLYGDAGVLVNQLKQRIPKLVLNNPDSKCILMANEPLGDIEYHLPPSDTHDHGTLRKEHGPRMRIRLRRSRQSLEIARCLPRASKTGAGEWVRKVFITVSGSYDMAKDDWNTLDPAEKMGIKCLSAFLRICDTLEAPQTDDSTIPQPQLLSSPTLAQASTRGSSNGRPHLEEVVHQREGSATPNVHDNVCTSHAPSTKSVLPSLSLPQRPPKFSRTMSSHSDGTGSATRQGSSGDRGKAPLEAVGLRAQTSFLPATGWCIRYQTDHGELYKIMFHDGATLEVNPGGDRVQLSNFTGEDMNLTFREALRDKELAERMTAFDSFAEMFQS